MRDHRNNVIAMIEIARSAEGRRIFTATRTWSTRSAPLSTGGLVSRQPASSAPTSTHVIATVFDLAACANAQLHIADIVEQDEDGGWYASAQLRPGIASGAGRPRRLRLALCAPASLVPSTVPAVPGAKVVKALQRAGFFSRA